METEFDSAELRKARGAFFTPPEVCDFVVRWAIRSSDDAVLEPSCGEAAFMLPAARRLTTLGAEVSRVAGYELHEPSAKRARHLLALAGVPDAQVRVGDFLAAAPEPRYSAVVGNPPYIRYQGFHGEARATGLRAALAQGVRLTNLASSWASFVVHSAAFLTPSGRLALVLPAELLSSNYAAEIREFLLARFASVKLVLFDRHVFPRVQTEAVLLLAEGTGGTEVVSIGRVHKASDLDGLTFDLSLQPSKSGGKWTHALVDPLATSAIEELTSVSAFSELAAWGRISLGGVTGNNKFFTLSPNRAADLGLSRSDTTRISPPGSGHLRALSLSRAAYMRLGKEDQATLLFSPRNPSAAAMRYIKQGEQKKVHEAFKCRVRDPWWRVPMPSAPSLFFTYMNAQTPQLCANPLGLQHLNSLHGLYLSEGFSQFADVLALASLNSVTMLSAEIVGRSYGGGILKMEPREAAALAVPAPAVVTMLTDSLSDLFPRAKRLLQAGQLAEAVSLVDRLVLEDGMGVSSEIVSEIRRSRNLLAHRRQTRGSKKAAETGRT
ncbi:N-6 DNA methylase [Kribbella sp. NPDC049584]|uniref:HsdM family class I SAM-dependent methyltransferase n=1 Tax=Kribbella sp. NPDC049584 TaxID=3154833 RepID=UPI003417E6E1